jgi:dihydropteroate synthase
MVPVGPGGYDCGEVPALHEGFVPRAWAHASGVLSLERPRVMGIVNLTPDSFFDGGRLFLAGRDGPDVDLVVRRCSQLVEDGADLVDIGGESTRPGAQPVAPELEAARVVPVIARLPSLGVPISVDTRHAEVARRAIDAGADIINDVSGLADPEMAAVVAEAGVGLVVGHLRGRPQTMQRHVAFRDVLREVADELAAVVDRAVAQGVARSHIVVDPGIGFGKSAEQSAALVAGAQFLTRATRCPVLIGASRKRFLQAFTGAPVERRLAGSLCAALVAVQRGASLVRVHDVRETVEVLAVAAGIDSAYERASGAAAHEGGQP